MKRSICAILLVLASCTANRVYEPGAAPSGAAQATSGAPVDATSGYPLNNADKVRITVYNEPTLSGDFAVNPNGNLALPLIGEVPAQGRTPAQVRTTIEQKLAAGFLKEPRVSMEVLTLRPYYVLGEVNHAGEFAYSDGITVLQAIAAAQGFTYRANKNRVFVKRAGVDQEMAVPLTSTLKVYPGDTIRVGERYF